MEAVLTQLSEKDYNLSKENGRFWGEINTHKYLFDRQEKECELIKHLTVDEFRAYFEKLFFSEGVKRIDVEITAAGHADKQAEWKELNEKSHYQGGIRKQINDSIATFKKKMALHPDTFKANYAASKL